MISSVIGIDIQSGQRVEISQSSRSQGLYIIGSVATGKSTLIENLVVQDIEQGQGVCVLDPNGDLTQAILSLLPANRIKDVILLDILDEQYPFGLNLLEYGSTEGSFAALYSVEQTMHIFERLFNKESSTPLLKEYLRNCTYTLIANPGYSIVDIPLLLTDEKTRKMLVANVPDVQVRLFWQRYDNLKPNQQRAEARLLLSTLQEFLQPFIRNILGQAKTTINFRQVMDEGKILLVKLDAPVPFVINLIGSVIVSELSYAVHSHSEYPINLRKQFNLYMDEFFQFATEDFNNLVREARHFGIAITIAHQSRDQLDRQTKAATNLLSNLVAFKINSKDAEELAPRFDFSPIRIATTLESISQDDGQKKVVNRPEQQRTIADMQNEIALHLSNLPKFTAMVKIVSVNGFVEHTIKTFELERGVGHKELQERITAIHAQNLQDGYLRRRDKVEEEINKRQQRLLEKSASFRSQFSWFHETAHFDKKPPIDQSVAVLNEPEVLQTLVRIRILEEPLTAQNHITIVSALTELYTKCWLLGQGRFADLIEYTQTGNTRFAQEAHLVIASVTYNSPFSIDWKVDLSAPSVAEAFVTAIDAVTQRQQRLAKAELENKAKQQEIEQSKQKADQDNKLAQLEQERKELQVERERLELLEKRLEVQKKGIEFAIEIANKMVDIMRPNADEDTRAMLIQAFLPNLLQLENGKGLELVFPKPLYSVREIDENT